MITTLKACHKKIIRKIKGFFLTVGCARHTEIIKALSFRKWDQNNNMKGHIGNLFLEWSSGETRLSFSSLGENCHQPEKKGLN